MKYLKYGVLAFVLYGVGLILINLNIFPYGSILGRLPFFAMLILGIISIIKDKSGWKVLGILATLMGLVFSFAYIPG